MLVSYARVVLPGSTSYAPHHVANPNPRMHSTAVPVGRHACSIERTTLPTVCCAAPPSPPPSPWSTLTARLQRWRHHASGLQQQLTSYGMAGLVAYGVLNTLYYTVAFVVYWTWVVQAERGLGMGTAAARFAEAMAVTWAGSQVTKVPRAAGAVALAPYVDRLINRTHAALGWSNRMQVVVAMIGLLLLGAGATFGAVLLAWA